MTISLLLMALSCLSAETELTPFGADAAASDDGRIPAWSGGLAEPPVGYEGPGHRHVDPYANDEPLYTIDAENLEQHAEELSPGLEALLTRYGQSFRIPVYPTRRSHAAPDWVYASTLEVESSARLNADGTGFKGAWAAIPFRRPEQPLEVYWNHVARWRGEYIESTATDLNVYADGRYTRLVRDTRVRFDYYQRDRKPDNRLFSLLSRVTAPASKAGGGVLVLETIDQDAEARNAWLYDSGRRRVLRAPTLEFDMSLNAADGLMTADDVDIINGSPERFEWTLLGKQELLVPYNSYRLAARELDESLVPPGHLDPEALRFERHRVWVLEARVKPEWRHAYSRRVLYIDEDSWTALMADLYDSRGQLWRVSLALTMNYYEIPATLPVAYAYHDLAAGRLHVKGLRSAEQGPPATLEKVPGDNQFSPQGLRRFVR